MTNLLFTTLQKMIEGIKDWLKDLGMKLLFYVVVAVICLIVFIGWNMFQKGKALIDNPTDQAITFTLNDKEYSLEPHTSKEISLKDGDHKLVIDDKEFEFTKWDQSKDKSVIDGLLTTASLAIVNPTLSDYVIAYQMYGHGPDSAWPEDKLITGQVYFETNVTFDLDQEFPESFSISRGRLYTVINKLYRLSDYIAEFDDKAEEE